MTITEKYKTKKSGKHNLFPLLGVIQLTVSFYQLDFTTPGNSPL